MKNLFIKQSLLARLDTKLSPLISRAWDGASSLLKNTLFILAKGMVWLILGSIVMHACRWVAQVMFGVTPSTSSEAHFFMALCLALSYYHYTDESIG